MSQAIVDPAELRRFAHNLKHFNSELEHRLSSLRSQVSSLGQSWRDQEQEKFASEFDQTMLVLGRFIESANEHIPFLLRKAERIEQYLDQR
jgi:WXG100 family type VII secretion target